MFVHFLRSFYINQLFLDLATYKEDSRWQRSQKNQSEGERDRDVRGCPDMGEANSSETLHHAFGSHCSNSQRARIWGIFRDSSYFFHWPVCFITTHYLFVCSLCSLKSFIDFLIYWLKTCCRTSLFKEHRTSPESLVSNCDKIWHKAFRWSSENNETRFYRALIFFVKKILVCLDTPSKFDQNYQFTRSRVPHE